MLIKRYICTRQDKKVSKKYTIFNIYFLYRLDIDETITYGVDVSSNIG